MANYYINDDILTIASDFNKNIDNDIKNIINTNNISCIKFFSTKYEILNQLNFPGSCIKSLIINTLSTTISNFTFYFGDRNKPIIKLDNLPTSLESLEINIDCEKFGLDLQMFKNLPLKLKKLKLSSCKNIIFDNLPNKLEVLDIICFSDQKNLLDYLPASLKYLNIKITNVLTREMILSQNLVYSCSIFGWSLDSLPSGLESLKITGQYDGELNCLPVYLKILHLPSGYNNEIKNIPKNLEELKISLKYEHLEKLQKMCSSLKKIIIGFSNATHSRNITNFDLKTIPKSVEEIEFGDDFNQSLENLSPDIKKITFGFNFKQESIILSDSIEYLEFGYCFNGIVKKYPSNLKYLKFGRNFNQNIDNLPEGLISLTINEHFHYSINKLPSTLQIIEFNSNAEYEKDIMIIPESIHTIILGKYMKKNKINIPGSLKNITYPENNIWIKVRLYNIGFLGTITVLKTEIY